MAESFKSKRVIFPKGKQREFLLLAEEKLNLTTNELADLATISVRNFNDWKNEKISMPLSVVKVFCKKIGIALPRNIEIKDRYWYTLKGARKGGVVRYRKYGMIGDPRIRKKKWEEWWKSRGKYIKHKILEPLPFNKPRYSKKLAEFVGIILGDGGITDYQIKVTLHSVDDFHYSVFVEKLIFDLFQIKSKKHERFDYSVLNIIISRVALVKFSVEKLGLKKGNKIKQQVDIPRWIMKKKSYKIACLRGLVDTDGCVIIHRYQSSGKYYTYEKLAFTSRSLPLLRSVREILYELNIDSRITKDGFDIRIECQRDVQKYFSIVGTNNPKHLKRYKKQKFFQGGLRRMVRQRFAKP